MSQFVTTTIAIPAANRNLETLAIAKDDWAIKGSGDDAFLARAIARCSAAAEQFCNRSFALETVVDTIQLERDPYPYQVPAGAAKLQLSRYPVVALTSLIESDDTANSQTLVEGDDFSVNYATGQVLRLDTFGRQMAWPALVYVATYSAGYVLPGDQGRTLPVDIEDAVSRMVWTRYAERQRDPFIAEVSTVGVETVKYLPGVGDAGNLSADVADILDNYRVPVIA